MKFHNAILPIAAALAVVAPLTVHAQGFNPGNRVGGQVTAVDSAKHVVTVRGWNQQSQTFKVTAATDYRIATMGSISNLNVGDKIRVMGQPSEDDENTIDARMIMVLPPNGGGFGGGRGAGRPGGPNGGGNRGAGRPGGPNGGGRRFGVTGTIATLSPKFTVTTSENETKTIDTTDDTRVLTSKPGTFGDIATGKNVMAIMSNGVATHVQIMPSMPGGGGWRRRDGNGNGNGNG